MAVVPAVLAGETRLKKVLGRDSDLLCQEDSEQTEADRLETSDLDCRDVKACEIPFLR